MIGLELSLIPGVMLGIEFPEDPDGVIFVIDLFIIRMVLWAIREDEIPKDVPNDKAP